MAEHGAAPDAGGCAAVAGELSDVRARLISMSAIRESEHDLVADLRAVGVNVTSVYDLVNTARPYPAAYPVLVRHLALPHERNTREGIIRALTVKDANAVAGRALLKEFEREDEPILKWVLANAVRTVVPLKERKRYPKIAEVLRRGIAP